MIVSHIIGGLGNQMFQYAAGRALSLERGVPLCLDIQDFAGYALHNGYELDRVFNIKTRPASDSDLRSVLGWRSFGPIRRLLFRSDFAKCRGASLFVDSQIAYWPGILLVPDNCYIMGNWQSEKYFKQAEDVLRADFSFKAPLSGINAELSVQISTCIAVSLHVRRGDIAANPASLAVHGLCSLDYYRRAVKYVTDHTAHAEFFIFSDDVPWVRENLHLAHPCHYIDHNNGLESYNDMRLMSLCRHHIIANSSFSWWGAWLNASVGKIVVAPDRWFASGFDSSDIAPSSWIKM